MRQQDSVRRPAAKAKMLRTETPGVYQRGLRFVVVWRHRGRQHKKTYSTCAEALEARARHLSGNTQPDYAPRRRDSVERYARLWIDEYQGRTYHGISESTRADYRLSLEVHAIPALGHLGLREVMPRDIRQMVLDMEARGLRPSTIRKHVAPVKAMFATAFEEFLIDRDPAKPIRISSRRPGLDGPPKRRSLTHEELHRLLETLEPSDRLLVAFAVHTGLRCSELAGLEWQHLSLAPPATVSVRQQFRQGALRKPKTHYSVRTIPLAPGMAAALSASAAVSRPAFDDPVFPSPSGNRLDPHNFASRVLRPSARAAGLPGVGFHQLRHTCAAFLIEQGKDLKQVQEWLGHSQARVTMQYYMHLLDRGLGEADFMDLMTGHSLFGPDEPAATGGLKLATSPADGGPPWERGSHW